MLIVKVVISLEKPLGHLRIADLSFVSAGQPVENLHQVPAPVEVLGPHVDVPNQVLEPDVALMLHIQAPLRQPLCLYLLLCEAVGQVFQPMLLALLVVGSQGRVALVLFLG